MEGNLATHQGIYNLITQYGNTMQPTYSQEGGPGGRKTLAGPLRSDGFATKVKYKSHKSLRSSGSKGTPGETRPSSVRITTVCMKIPTNKSNRRGNMWDSTGSPPPAKSRIGKRLGQVGNVIRCVCNGRRDFGIFGNIGNNISSRVVQDETVLCCGKALLMRSEHDVSTNTDLNGAVKIISSTRSWRSLAHQPLHLNSINNDRGHSRCCR